MMDRQDQLKIQAHLDGELSGAEAREAAQLLARDPDAALLLKELRQTREALAGFDDGIKLPESREFYWSKIERRIRAEEAPAPAVTAIPWWVQMRRLLVPVSALALVVIAGFFASNGVKGVSGPAAEVSLTDSQALTYRDYAVGATLVWLSFPAENEVAQVSPAGTFE